MNQLWQPLSGLGKNRIWLAPLTNLQSHQDGSLSDVELEWLRRRAQGGFGVIETCASHVSPEGQGWKGELGIFHDRFLPGLTKLAEVLKAEGSVPIVQIFHGGLRASTEASGLSRLSPSGLEQSQAMTADEIKRVIEDFGNAAKRAESAGFSGVEIHGAHGYLISQFLSSHYNTRTDEWGGTLEKRQRFLFEIIQNIRSRVGARFIVGLRMSVVSTPSLPGIHLRESLNLISKLKSKDIQFLHASLWDYHRTDPDDLGSGPLTPQLRRVLDAEIPLVVAGGIQTQQQALEVLSQGADAVAIGKMSLGNPDWPKTVGLEGKKPMLPPYTSEYLLAQSMGPAFLEYMRRTPGFVSDVMGGN